MEINKQNIDLSGRLVVLGGGESGTGAAVLGKVKGMDVFLSDMGKIPEKYKEMLRNHSIPFEEGQHTEEKILNATVVVKSPGIPPYAPMVEKIAGKGIPVLSEIEFAAGFTDSRMVCITGSNGKTTTTLLTYHILRKAGLDVGLAGNVGKSLALQVALEPHENYVIELSSFQLENMYQFKANIAVILNITPDHLDRYDHKMENYAAAKFRILQNQTRKISSSIGKTTQSSASKSDTCRARRCVSPSASTKRRRARHGSTMESCVSPPPGMYGKYHATRFPFLDFIISTIPWQPAFPPQRFI